MLFMIAYHLDRRGRLSPGMTIDKIVCENTFGLPYLSNWGASVSRVPEQLGLGILDASAFSCLNMYNIEIQAEHIRKSNFPHLPSRLSSFYGVSTQEELLAWLDVLGRTENARVFEVSYSGDAPKLDAAFLNLSATNDPFLPEALPDLCKRSQKIQDNLACYWNGAFSAAPLPELLLPLPVAVLREISFHAPPDR